MQIIFLSAELVLRLFAQRAAVVQIIIHGAGGLEAVLTAVLGTRQSQNVTAPVATGGGEALAVVVAAATIARKAIVARVSVFLGGAAVVATRETAVARATVLRWFGG